MEKISEILKDLAEKHNIIIIYAVEAGSRAWSLESDDSDYDIRFIYKHTDVRKYLSLKPFDETIDGFSDDRVYDWQGWDITKALKLLHQMNPSIVEWIYSPIVYHNAPDINLRQTAQTLLNEQKRIVPLLYHYRSMAKSNYKTHIENKSNVKIKKYLYVIRPAGMFEWLLKCYRENQNQNQNANLVEIDFNIVLNDLKPVLDEDCYKSIVKVIEKKKIVKELDEEPRIECIDKWIETILKNTNDILKEIETNMDSSNKLTLTQYDQVLFSILKV